MSTQQRPVRKDYQAIMRQRPWKAFAALAAAIVLIALLAVFTDRPASAASTSDEDNLIEITTFASGEARVTMFNPLNTDGYFQLWLDGFYQRQYKVDSESARTIVMYDLPPGTKIKFLPPGDGLPAVKAKIPQQSIYSAAILTKLKPSGVVKLTVPLHNGSTTETVTFVVTTTDPVSPRASHEWNITVPPGGDNNEIKLRGALLKGTIVQSSVTDSVGTTGQDVCKISQHGLCLS